MLNGKSVFAKCRIEFKYSPAEWNLDFVSVMENAVQRLTRLPKVVFVKFPGTKWTLPGFAEAGLYPIPPRRSQWHLDKGRPHSVLKIIRHQVPLAPAFAITAHAAQGQTLKAAKERLADWT